MLPEWSGTARVKLLRAASIFRLHWKHNTKCVRPAGHRVRYYLLATGCSARLCGKEMLSSFIRLAGAKSCAKHCMGLLSPSSVELVLPVQLMMYTELQCPRRQGKGLSQHERCRADARNCAWTPKPAHTALGWPTCMPRHCSLPTWATCSNRGPHRVSTNNNGRQSHQHC